MFILSFILFFYLFFILMVGVGFLDFTSILLYSCFDNNFLILIFLLIFIVLVSFVFFYSSFYMKSELKLFYFSYTLRIFCFVMFFLVIINNSLFIIFFWDLLGLMRFFLIIYYLNENGSKGAIIRILTGRVGDFFIIIFFSYIIHSYCWVSSLWLLILPMWFFWALGANTKSSQFPFRYWLTIAMAAPTPVSSLVHRRTLVAAGLFMSYIFYISYLNRFFLYVLIFFRYLTIMISGILSFFELDSKKIVALRTISQISLCMFLILQGHFLFSFIYMVNHAIIKCILFILSGFIIYYSWGSQSKDSFFSFFSSLYISFLICLLSLCGLFFIRGILIKDLLLEGVFFFSLSIRDMLFYLLGFIFTFFYSSRLLNLGYFNVLFSFWFYKNSLIFFFLLIFMYFILIFIFNYFIFLSSYSYLSNYILIFLIFVFIFSVQIYFVFNFYSFFMFIYKFLDLKESLIKFENLFIFILNLLFLFLNNLSLILINLILGNFFIFIFFYLILFFTS